MDFLMLELRDSFYFEPIAKKGTKDYERAEYTLRLLRLNAHEPLRQARENAFSGYRARLSEYLALREQGASRAELSRCILAIQRAPHVTVWKEMQRQHREHSELRRLFRDAPEALRW